MWWRFACLCWLFPENACLPFAQWHRTCTASNRAVSGSLLCMLKGMTTGCVCWWRAGAALHRSILMFRLFIFLCSMDTLHLSFISTDIYRKLYVKRKHVKRFPSGQMWFLFSLFTNPQDWFFRYLVWKDEFNIEGAALFGLIVTKLDSLQMTQSLWAAQPRPTVTVRSPIRVN